MMGKYVAHRIDALPPHLAARVHHVADALEHGIAFTDDERAEALAILASDRDGRQRSLALTPSPRGEMKANALAKMKGQRCIAGKRYFPASSNAGKKTAESL